MNILVRIVSLVALLLSIAWLAFKPGFDSSVATAAALAAFLASLLYRKAPPANPDQSQSVSGGSIGIQAGRDVKTGKIER